MNDPQHIAILRHMDGLVFDAVFNEDHQSELSVTENPVESGVMIADHAYMKPVKLSIKAGVSDVSLRYWKSTGKLGKEAFEQTDDDPFASPEGRTRRAYELLTELQATREPFAVQTGLKLYQNMLCTSLQTNQDKDSAHSLVFTATLCQVLIVHTQKVTYPPRQKGPTTRQAAKKKDKGEQQCKIIQA